MKDVSKMVLLGLVILFGLLSAFFGYKYFQMEKVSEVYLEEKDQIKTDYDDLVAEFEVLENELNMMETSNQELHAEIESQKEELENVRTLLNQEKVGRAELNKARAMIEQLKSEKNDLLAQIDALSEENTALKTENRNFSITLDSVSTQKAQLEEQNVVLASERDSITTTLEEERVENAPKLAFAQVVPVKNIYAEGVKYKNSGREKTTSNYKRIDKLAVTFTVDENPVAEPGEKEYLLRIINPDGTIVYDTQRGSGTFTSAVENEGMKYTAKTYVDYDQEEKQVSLFWRQDLPYQKGNYLVEVYQQGFKVGEGAFELKGGL